MALISGQPQDVLTDTWSGGYVRTAGGVFISKAANELSMTDAGLLSQPSRTNLIVRSNDLGSTSWNAVRATVASTALTTPIGSTFWKVVCDTTNTNPGSRYQNAAVSAGTYTWSCIAKRDTSDWVALQVYDNGNTSTVVSAYFNLLTGALGAISGPTTGDFIRVGSNINALPDGSYRIEVTLTLAVPFTLSARCCIVDSNGTPASTAGKSAFFSDAQLENGTYASMPIVTAATTVARTGNRQSGSLAGKLNMGVAGFIKFDALSLENVSAGRAVFSLNDGSTANYFSVHYASSGNLRIGANSGGAGSAVSGTVAAHTGAPFRTQTVAFIVSQGLIAARAVGSTAGQVAVAGIPLPINMSRLGIGGNGYSDGNNVYQLTKKLSLVFGSVDRPVNQALFDQVYAQAEAA